MHYSYDTEWVIRVSKVKWIRQVVINQIEWEIDQAEKEIEEWKKLKEALTETDPKKV